MRFKLDEDLPIPAAELLRERGHDVTTVREQGLGGAKDSQVWEAAKGEERCLITADKGFADLRHFPPGDHPGIIVLRPNEDGIRPIIDLLRQLLDFPLAEIPGALAVVTPQGVRIRRRKP